MHEDLKILQERIRAARREIPADLVLKRARVLNVFSGGIQENDVALHRGLIVGLGPDYQGNQEVELRGKWVAPGLIDGHLHIESSMLSPANLADALLPHGTTAIVSDPHEIANVMGIEGIRLMIRESRGLPMDIFFMAPSCVPSTDLETSGAEINAADLAKLRGEPKILGLAEMMNFPGVLTGTEAVLEKLLLFQDEIIDGHAPGLRGYDLQAYLTAGVRSDHEAVDQWEAEEKLNNGMLLMIREGTSAKNLKDLLPALTERNIRQVCLVSDDLHPGDISKRGHLDFVLKKAMNLGLDPLDALQAVTLNPARFFGLKDRGAVAPGFRADLIVLDDLDQFKIKSVYKDGRLVVRDGELLEPIGGRRQTPKPPAIELPSLRRESFHIHAEGKKARIIELIPGQILTRSLHETVKIEDDRVVTDVEKDILRLAVVERHKSTGRIGLGLVRGFGLKAGALASSVAHDSHNIIAVGVRASDLYEAVRALMAMGGGMVAAREGVVLAEVPLEVAGIMSNSPLDDLTHQLEAVNRAAESLGCRIPEPFMSLSFLALPVIPDLKLTDRGLVDVKNFQKVPLFLDES
ncbi:adenine deaminase [Thermodesulfobacteriota bacterium]